MADSKSLLGGMPVAVISAACLSFQLLSIASSVVSARCSSSTGSANAPLTGKLGPRPRNKTFLLSVPTTINPPISTLSPLPTCLRVDRFWSWLGGVGFGVGVAVGVGVGVGLGVAVGVAVGVGVGVGFGAALPNSKAPMSGLPTRGNPRWSVGGAIAALPALIAGLVCLSPIVSVAPPLFARPAAATMASTPTMLCVPCAAGFQPVVSRMRS